MNLGHIFKFITGAENEPVVGYGVAPSIAFAKSLSPYPTANTCINKLCLAICESGPIDQDAMFQVFDLAFVNDHFGLI